MTRTTTRLSVSVLTLGVVLAGVTACGSSKKSSATGGGSTSAAAPADAHASFTQALEAAGKSDGTVTFKLAATAADLTALSKLSGSSSSAASDQKLVSLLSSGSIVFEHKGKDAEFSVVVGGAPVVQFRTVAKQPYLRIDVAKINTLAGGKLPTQSLDVAAAQPQFAFLKDALAGKWLHITGADAFVKQFQGLAGGSASASANAGQLKSVRDKLVTALEGDVTVKDAGSAPQGEHLVLSAPLKKVATDFQSIVSALPGVGLAGKQLSSLSKVPDRAVTIDAFVKSGDLTALQLDLVQFAPPADAAKVAGRHAPLELDFSTDAPTIDAPSGAATLDLGALGSTFAGLLGSLSGGKA
jgi:hypothetical protein